MKKLILIAVFCVLFVGVAYGQESIIIKVSSEIDMDVDSPTYMQCIGWEVVPDTVYSFVTDGAGDRVKFPYQDALHMTFTDEQTWLIPVGFGFIDPGVAMQYYKIKFLASAAGVFPSKTVTPIQGSGKPVPGKPIPDGIHSYWLTAKVGLLEFSDAVPAGIVVIKTAPPKPNG